MRRASAFDMPLFLSVLILVGLGIIFIYSASYPKAMAISETGGNSSYFAIRQIIFVSIGMLLMGACMYTPLAVLRRNANYIGWFIFGLLVLTLVVGAAKFGNRSWIQLGPFQMQPSEFAKIGIVVTLAAYLSRYPWTVKTLRGLATGPILFLVVPVGLIVMQGDLGTAFITSLATVAMLLVGGMKARYVVIPALLAAVVLPLMVLSSNRVERFEGWLHPFSDSQASYHPRNSLIAVGSGGLLGLGFCESLQKWYYLPAPHNDYIFAVMAEELGFLWLVLLLFVPYFFLIYQGFNIAHRAPDEFSALVAAGCTLMLATQAFVNMAVVLNIIPSMGINMPFISYGGSSILASMMMAGLLLNVSSRCQRRTREEQVEVPAGA